MAKKVTKKAPQDATMRNVRAANRKIGQLHTAIEMLFDIAEKLESEVLNLGKRVTMQETMISSLTDTRVEDRVRHNALRETVESLDREFRAIDDSPINSGIDPEDDGNDPSL